jgi:purine nucleosidase/pyrimidine-specific ribonucleoside hydrolase
MGGSTERGNRTPYAEFNAWADPEAAAAVFASDVPVTMIGLNLTHQALATDAVIARVLALGTPLAETVAGWFAFFGETYRTLFGFPAPPVHDPCAVALVAEPATIRTVEAFVAIETEGAWTRGATAVDLDGRLGQAPNARVATELDVERFWNRVVDAIDRLGG